MFGVCGSHVSVSVIAASGIDLKLWEGLMSSFCIFVLLTLGGLSGGDCVSEWELSLRMICSKLWSAAVMLAKVSLVLVV